MWLMQACTYVPGNMTIDLLSGIPSDRSYISYMCGPARRPRATSRHAPHISKPAALLLQ
jgi:hypothetical protein